MTWLKIDLKFVRWVNCRLMKLLVRYYKLLECSHLKRLQHFCHRQFKFKKIFTTRRWQPHL